MDAATKWQRLTEANRRALLEEHRDDLQYEWWDSVYNMFREDMKEIGVRVDNIYFSGFWSQGDGACFEGHISDWSKFLPAVGMSELVDEARGNDISLSWKHRGHYYHEHSVSFDVDDLWISNPYDEDEDLLRFTAWDATNPEGGQIYERREEIIEFLRDKMRTLYSALEEEHDYLTSDEVTEEYILGNHLEEIDDLLDQQDEERAADAQQSFIF